MDASYLPLFCDRDTGGGLEFVGAREGDELLDGTLLAEGREVGEVVEGVACLWPHDNWSEDDLARTMTSDWLTRKWQDKVAYADPTAASFCEELAGLDGVILEIAAGPGGGNLQGLLHRNPGARLMVNDTSTRLLQRWRRFLLEGKLAERVCFAAFDARSMALRDESVSAVSGVAAFSNIGGPDVVDEAFRVLRPGGAVYTRDMVVDPDDWARLPAGFREREEARAPGFTRGTAGLLAHAGFRIVYEGSIPGRPLTADEDGIQEKADPYGVTLHVRFGDVKAWKPA